MAIDTFTKLYEHNYAFVFELIFLLQFPEQYKICADFLKVCNIPIVYLETSKAAGERFHYTTNKTQKK